MLFGSDSDKVSDSIGNSKHVAQMRRRLIIVDQNLISRQN